MTIRSESASAPQGGADRIRGDLFAKCRSPRLDEYRAAEALGLLPYYVELNSGSAPVIEHHGKTVVMLGSNNYLGLTTDPRVKRAAVDAIERFGTGCTGSRLMNGTLPLHTELEEELADWVGAEAALVFTTGYAVNLGLLSTLVDGGDLILADLASHASIMDGGQLSPGTVRSFRHNDPDSLDRRLRRWLADQTGAALVAVDGVYSMEGDVAPLPEIASVCSLLGARLLVDEAHALGVLGPEGAGASAAAGILPDLVMGTFSKSLASCGGFVAASDVVIDYLRIACRPFLFTASGVPAALAAALMAVQVSRAEEWRREALRARADQLRHGLDQLGYRVGDTTVCTAIVPVHVDDEWSAARLWRQLLDGGVYTNCAVAPAVRSGRALLRGSVMATHSEKDIDRALSVFEAVR